MILIPFLVFHLVQPFHDAKVFVNGPDKSKNQIELHLLQGFRNDQHLNNNKTILIAINPPPPKKTYPIKTARKYALRWKMRVSSKCLNELRGPLKLAN